VAKRLVHYPDASSAPLWAADVITHGVPGTASAEDQLAYGYQQVTVYGELKRV
jgi:hypothetical protein